MKPTKKIAALLAAISFFAASPAAYAVSGEEIEAEDEYLDEDDDWYFDGKPADDWFGKGKENYRIKNGDGDDEENSAAVKKSKEEKLSDKLQKKEDKFRQKSDRRAMKEDSQRRRRFLKLFSDEKYNYYMDTRNAMWRRIPYSASEQMIDVWIRLDDKRSDLIRNGVTADDAETQTYYLEHYYIRPARRQIQFLCELEVTGSPDNAVEQRKYQYRNWEELVPGSVEDDIYHAVVKRMNKKGSFLGIPSAGRSGRDMIEDYLRISL